LPGGGVGFLTNAIFHSIGSYGFFWLASQLDPTTAWHGSLSNGESGVAVDYDDRSDGFSLRCVEN
jgi:hypothetical protein